MLKIGMRCILLIMIILIQFKGALGKYRSPCFVGLLFVFLVLQRIFTGQILILVIVQNENNKLEY